MPMSAKTPGSNVDKMNYKPGILRGHHLAAYPPLLVNIGLRASSTDYADGNNESSVIFSPEGAMFLPINPSNEVQSSSPTTQEQTLPSSLSTIAPSSLEFQLASLGSGINTSGLDQLSVMPLSVTSTSTTDALATSAPSSPSLQASNGSSSTSQAQAGFVATPSSIATSSATSSATTPTTSSTALPSLTTSQVVSSPSATSTLQRDSENLPRVAEVVIGVVGAISLIAFLATLGSWIYKQHHRKTEHAEIISITSFNDTPHRGFFGCLTHRRSKATDDMSELGFGLGRVAFFSDPNSSIEHHHVGLTLDAENTIQGDKKKINGTDGDACSPPQNPFDDHFSVDRTLSMVRPFPGHLQNDMEMTIARSVSVFPYQHLASANALGGLNVTPLTVANFVPGDTSGDEGKHSAVLPSYVIRQPSVGTPRIGASIPRFMSLVEDDALAVPWAPLDIRRNELRSLHEKQDLRDLGDEEEAREQDTGHRPLQISRTATFTLEVSKTLSRRLGHSLSKSSDWRIGVTRPPTGTFRVAWDAHNKADGAVVSTGTEKHWATTLKNNLFSAWNAVGSSMHVNNSGNRNVDPDNIPTNPGQSSPTLGFIPYNGQIESASDPLEDILTPPPAKIAAMRLERTKGSIIRGKLAIGAGSGAGHGTGLGLDLASLSRSSTLSTCWSDSEEPNAEMVRKARMRVRALSRTGRLVQRSGTSSTATSMTRLAPRNSRNSGRERLGLSANGKHMNPPSKRPRFSRLPMSQSSMWSSTSYASPDCGAEPR